MSKWVILTGNNAENADAFMKIMCHKPATENKKNCNTVHILGLMAVDPRIGHCSLILHEYANVAAREST